MSIIDCALEANRKYTKKYDPRLAQRPAPKIAVVTCMDPRVSNLPEILGLRPADIDVIRTGESAVTEDVLAELLLSTQVLGTKRIMLLNHTGCDFCDSSPGSMHFFAYKDPVQNTRAQIKTVRSHPWIAKQIPVRGFVFDLQSGVLTEVEAELEQAAA
jgi:carbonic anhydrase